MSEDYQIITFGCRLNTYESEVIRAHVKTAELANAVIINTCAVTGEAERQARQAIRKARRENPEAKIIVTGCAAQINPAQFIAMPEVDHVIGNARKLDLNTYQSLEKTRVCITDMQETQTITAQPVQGFEGKSRAFVQVQNGCNHRCTFCIIPFGRGPSRSVPVEAVIRQVRTLTAQGYREMTLTGVDITSYGADLPGKPTLGKMIRLVLDADSALTRLRLSSLDPAAIDEDLWRLVASEPRLMPHLHLSLQSGDSIVLKRMKRRHTPDDLLRLCERARKFRSDIVFGADIITGFPTETEEMFENTEKLVEQLDITFLHVFPYSARVGTPAARMSQVPVKIRRERASRLRALGEKALIKHLDSLIGQYLDVLVEKPELGRAPTFAEVKLLSRLDTGKVARVKCIGREGFRVVARVMEDS